MKHFPSSDVGMFGRRQWHARGHRIPVTITRTCIDKAAVLIVDDFADDEAPANQCSCCTIRTKLQQVIRECVRERPVSQLTIQTGADVVPILRTFVTERGLGDDFYIESAPPMMGKRFTVTESAPLSWDAFSRFATTLTVLRGADLLHAQGVMNIEGCRGPVAVQLMGHLAARPVELQAWPDGERASRLEFVTRNIEERTVRDLFDATRTLA